MDIDQNRHGGIDGGDGLDSQNSVKEAAARAAQVLGHLDAHQSQGKELGRPGRGRTAARRPSRGPAAQWSPRQTAAQLEKKLLFFRELRQRGRVSGSVGKGRSLRLRSVSERHAHACLRMMWAIISSLAKTLHLTIKAGRADSKTKRADSLRSLPRPSFNQDNCLVDYQRERRLRCNRGCDRILSLECDGVGSLCRIRNRCAATAGTAAACREHQPQRRQRNHASQLPQFARPTAP